MKSEKENLILLVEKEKKEKLQEEDNFQENHHKLEKDLALCQTNLGKALEKIEEVENVNLSAEVEMAALTGTLLVSKNLELQENIQTLRQC